MRKSLVYALIGPAALVVAAAELPAQNPDYAKDAHTLHRGLLAIHPDPLHAICLSDLERQVQRFVAEAPGYDRAKAIVELNRIAALLRDGHSGIQLTRPAETRFHQFPVRFYMFSDGIFVRSIDRELAPFAGAKLIAIDGMPADEAFRRVSEVTQHENLYSLYEVAMTYFSVPEVLKATGVAKSDQSVALTVIPRGSSEPQTITLSAVGGTDIPGLDNSASHIGEPLDPPEAATLLADMTEGIARPLWLRNAEEMFAWHHDPRTGIFYVQYNGVRDTGEQSFADFTADMFRAFDASDATKFVIDLRLNTGGDSSLLTPLIRGVMARERIMEPGAFFTLIGRHTFSAASQLVTRLETLTPVIFVGEPTGGRPHHWGDAIRIPLDQTGTTSRVAVRNWNVGSANDPRDWTPPHIGVPLTSADFAAGRDAALEAVVSYDPRNDFRALLTDLAERGDFGGLEALYRAYTSDPRNRWIDLVSVIDQVGVELSLVKNRPEDALRLFEFNAAMYPEVASVHVRLGSSYERRERPADALKAWETAFRLNPKLYSPARAIRRLGGDASMEGFVSDQLQCRYGGPTAERL